MIRCDYDPKIDPALRFSTQSNGIGITFSLAHTWMWERGATDRTMRVPYAAQRLAFLPDLWRVCP